LSDKIVHISLPEETHRLLKMQAAAEGMTLAEMIQKMIKVYCEKKIVP
jgi:predicted DNA binding CopG/RHH family protein